MRRLLAGRPSGSVLVLRLAAAPPAWRTPRHHRLALAALHPLLQAHEARCFRLADDSLVTVWRGEASAAEQSCRAALARLFAGAGTQPGAALLARFELPQDAGAVLAVLAAAGGAPAPAAKPDRTTLPPLEPQQFAALESRLAAADVARFARRRDVCAPGPGGRFVLRWEKRFLSAAWLGAALLGGGDPRSDKWLFRSLTRTLDERLLALLSTGATLRDAAPFAINLNVSSILSPGFLRFDAGLPGPLRGQVVLALSLADILADPAAFRFARDFARARGYRLLLRGVAPTWVDGVRMAGLGVDYVQLRWCPALGARAELPFDPAAVVLARCRDPRAWQWGLRLGITSFHGRAVVRGRPMAGTGFARRTGAAPDEALRGNDALGAETPPA